MIINRKTRRFLALAAGLPALGVLVNVASASHSWGGYHWARTTSQFTLKLGNNLSTGWQTYINQASTDWNHPGAGSTPLLTSVVAGQNKRCSMISGTTQVCNSTYGSNGWLGLASISITGGGHITQGSAKMNDTYFNTSTYNNRNERQHVMCQEIAHTFGLDHQSTNGTSQNTCMDYFSNTGANAGNALSTRPNQHDFDELNGIYAHKDSTTTAAATTKSSAAGQGENNGENNEDESTWGMLVSQSNEGRNSTYEHYDQDGSKTLTHVFWTREAAGNCPSCDHRYDNGH